MVKAAVPSDFDISEAEAFDIEIVDSRDSMTWTPNWPGRS
jgi:hypothetical protein